MDSLLKIVVPMLEGAEITLQIFFITLILSVPLGMLFSLARLSSIKPVRYLTEVYIWLMRGTPLMLQLLFVYFALPMVGIRLPDIAAALLAFSLNYAAYFAEIFRAGIQSIDNGQMEAGRSLGLTWFQTMRYIIIPQAFKRVIPPLGNEFIALLKDSSLVSVIGFEELTRRGQLVIARTYASLEIWFCVAIIYLVMTLSISRFVAYLERRYQVDDRN